MQEKNSIKKALSATRLGEDELLASVKSAAEAKPRRIRISRLGLIAASLAAVVVLCSAGYAVIPAFRKYLDKRVKENVVYTDISTAEELDAIRNDLTGSYRLVSDIVIDGSAYEDGGIFERGFIPLGNSEKAFTGIFNGNGHKITNLRLNTDGTYVGLFGLTHSYSGFGIIMNLALENVTLTESPSASSFHFVGAIAGKAAYIGQCSVTGFAPDPETVSGSDVTLGGIAGQADIIESCCTDTTVTESSNHGAIAGIACIVTNCCAETSSPICGTVNRIPVLMTETAFTKLENLLKDDKKALEKFRAFYIEADLDASEQKYLKFPVTGGGTDPGISPDGVRSIYSLYNVGNAEELRTAYLFDHLASGWETVYLNEYLEQNLTSEEAGSILFGDGNVIGVTDSFRVSNGESYRGLDLKNTWVIRGGKPVLRIFSEKVS